MKCRSVNITLYETFKTLNGVNNMPSKKDYEAIAEILNRNIKAFEHLRSDFGTVSLPCDVINSIMIGFVRYFESDNPDFNRERFIKAVNGE